MTRDDQSTEALAKADVIEAMARALVTADPTITGYHETHIAIKRPAAEIVYDALHAAGLRVVKPDAGPWEIGQAELAGRRNPFNIYSNDGLHDVRLTLDGDFASDGERMAYAEWLVTQLNRSDAHDREGE